MSEPFSLYEFEYANNGMMTARAEFNWNPKRLIPLVLTWSRQCRHCGVQLLSSESDNKSFCCGGGKHCANYTPLGDLPPEYSSFTTSPMISRLSRKLNLAFSFAALETSMPFLSPANLGGPSFVVIQGRSYHRVRPEHQSSGIRWILFDGFEAGGNPHSEITEEIPLFWVSAVRSALRRENSFIKKLIMFSSQLPYCPRARIELAEDSMEREIAAVIRFDNTSLNEVTPRSIVIRQYGYNKPQRISTTSSLWEPLVYPLLFPKGTRGWQPRRGK
jgi:hypothetical protein